MHPSPSRSPRLLRLWLLSGVLMLLIQVVLGGITRLTGSGLSITEWNLATGVLPPLNQAGWQEAFSKYQQTPQYRLINSGFTLGDFKFIFFWEWFHRLWARTVGLVFLVGFAALLLQKAIPKKLVGPLLILFGLGALQGAVGWIMVASGLAGDAIYVAPTRLALHFVFALGLIAYTFWVYLSVRDPAGAPDLPAGFRILPRFLLALTFLQLIYGALLAGHKAAAVAPSWPTLNGDWIPPALGGDGALRFLEDKMVVQFMHRSIAYLLILLTGVWSLIFLRKPAARSALGGGRWLPLVLVLVQACLGIASLWASPGIVANHWGAFDWLAQLHQVCAMAFLLSWVWVLHRSRPRGHTFLEARPFP